jgi:voltage-dependent potassium channel beta subunit
MKIAIPLRQLGNTNIQISALGLGSWNTYGHVVTDQAIVNEIVHTAFDHGINFFDMANNYADGQAEIMMGIALRRLPRERLILSSKVFMASKHSERGLSEAKINRGIDNSLKRIGTDYLDIYFCHRYDPDTPLEETVSAMGKLVQQGKIRHWGTSTWSAAQIARAYKIAIGQGVAPPMVEQPELSLINQLDYKINILAEIKRRNMGVVTFSPLASGILSGKYADGIPEDSRFARIDWLRNSMQAKINRYPSAPLKALAAQHNCSQAQLAIAWVMAQLGVSSVITGASRVEQLIDNMGAAQITLPDETMRSLEQIYDPGLLRKIKRRLTQFIRASVVSHTNA